MSAADPRGPACAPSSALARAWAALAAAHDAGQSPAFHAAVAVYEALAAERGHLQFVRADVASELDRHGTAETPRRALLLARLADTAARLVEIEGETSV